MSLGIVGLEELLKQLREMEKELAKTHKIVDEQLKFSPDRIDVKLWIDAENMSKTFYCQRDIEGESRCEEQCEHCREYYKPLEYEK